MGFIGVRVSDEVKARLEKIAESQRRPLANLVRLIILDWLEEQKGQPDKK